MATFVTHRKARFDYEIIETIEAGLILHGYEVKSIRAGKARLEGSFIVVRGGEAFLTGMSISPYQVANTPKSYDPERVRKLLLNKKELLKIEQETETARLTAIPLKLYDSNRKIKVEIALVRGKKHADKRESIKKRDTKRDIDRIIKSQY